MKGIRLFNFIKNVIAVAFIILIPKFALNDGESHLFT